MAIEEKITEVLDRLTEDVNVPDAAILIGGFYAGMNGYTPLTMLLKMSYTSNFTPGTAQDEALWSLLTGIPGLVYRILTKPRPEETAQAMTDAQSIAFEDMDPRKINVDYLYERKMFLHRISMNRDLRINDLKLKIAEYEGVILDYQAEIVDIQKVIDNLKVQSSNLASQISNLEAEMANAKAQYDSAIAGINERIKYLEAQVSKIYMQWQAATGPAKIALGELLEKLNAEIQKMRDTKTTVDRQYSGYVSAKTSELQGLRSQYDPIAGWIRAHETDMRGWQDKIAAEQVKIDDTRKLIKIIEDEKSNFDSEIRKLDYELLKIKTSLGLIGMIEAYAITRPGTVSGIGEIIKGVGEIIPG